MAEQKEPSSSQRPLFISLLLIAVTVILILHLPGLRPRNLRYHDDHTFLVPPATGTVHSSSSTTDVTRNGVIFSFDLLHEKESDKRTALEILNRYSPPNVSVDFAEEQRRCVLDPPSLIMRSQRHASSFIAGNRSQVDSVLKDERTRRRPKVACLVTGLLRSYQEVLLAGGGRYQEFAFGTHGCTDIFVSSSSVRGWSQLRFGASASSVLLYLHAEHDVALEVNATFAAALAGIRETSSAKMRYIRVAPRELSNISKFTSEIHLNANLNSAPLYKHMAAALDAAEQEERRSGTKFDAFVQLRPDLLFREPQSLRFVFSGKENKEEELLLYLVVGENVITLAAGNIVVPSRRTDSYRTNDYLTIGGSAAMRRYLRNGYYLLRYGASNKNNVTRGIVSERAKRVLSSVLGLNVCSVRIPVDVRKRGRRQPNSVFCWRNCSRQQDTRMCRAGSGNSSGRPCFFL